MSSAISNNIVTNSFIQNFESKYQVTLAKVKNFLVACEEEGLPKGALYFPCTMNKLGGAIEITFESTKKAVIKKLEVLTGTQTQQTVELKDDGFKVSPPQKIGVN